MAGIDQILQQKMDIGRQNPQALMQSYQQNQDLMSLLAMQKLKSDKEAAQRDMMLQAQQSGTPPTISEQREMELLSMNKAELAQQAAMAGQQQAQQAQQAQQQAMQSLLQSGIGQLPASNMAGMAQGGIVGYQDGGLFRKRASNNLAGSVDLLSQLVQKRVDRLKEQGVLSEDEYSAAQRSITAGARSTEGKLNALLDMSKMLDGLDAPSPLSHLTTNTPAPQDMAQGGIVGYQDGGDVEGSPRLRRLTQQLIEAGMEPEAARAEAERTLSRGIPLPPLPGLPRVPNLLPDPTAPARATARGVGQLYDNLPDALSGGRSEDFGQQASAPGAVDALIPSSTYGMGDRTGSTQLPDNLLGGAGNILRSLLPSASTDSSQRGARQPRSEREDQRTGPQKTADAVVPRMSDEEIADFTQQMQAQSSVRGDDGFLTAFPTLSRMAQGDQSVTDMTNAQRIGAIIRDLGKGPFDVAGDIMADADINLDVGEMGRDFYAGITGQPITRSEAQPETQTQPAPQERPVRATTAAPARPAVMGPELVEGEARTPMDYLGSLARAQAERGQPPAPVEQAGLSALQQEINRAKAPRDDKLRYLADFLIGAGGRTSAASAMMGGATSAREQERLRDEEIRNLLSEQETVDFRRDQLEAEREFRTDSIAVQRDRLALEEELTREGFDRDDARAQSQMAVELARANRLDPRLINDIISDVRAELMDPLNAERMQGLFLAEFAKTGVSIRPRDMNRPDVVDAYNTWLNTKIREQTNSRLQTITGGVGAGDSDPELDELVRMYGS